MTSSGCPSEYEHRKATGRAGEHEPRDQLGEQVKPSMWQAVTRVADVGQRLVIDRLELMRLETRDDVLTIAKYLLLAAGTLPILLAGWIALLAGVALALSPVLPLAVSLCILGGIHAIAGGAGVYLGWSRLNAMSRLIDEPGNEETTTERLGAPSGPPTGEGAGDGSAT